MIRPSGMKPLVARSRRNVGKTESATLSLPLGLRTFLEIFARHVLLMGGDPPRVAKRVLHARGPVSVERVHRLPQGRRTRLEGPSVRRVGVRHVQEQRGLAPPPLPRRT